MCGIVGFAGNLSVKHEKAFADLLIMNQLRGFDSVGVAKLGYSRIPEVEKDIVDPVNFITSAAYTKMLRGINRVLIGHNRAATQGTINVENAHPFTHDHITGVHNGTLTYRRDLEEWQRFTVDSDNLYYHIAVKGEADLWTKLFGAASLVWWDAKNETLNFLRNKERPMYLAYDKEHKVICWASEFYMLLAACSRNGIILDKSPFSTEVDIHYAFALGKGYHNGKVLEPVATKLPCYSPPVYKHIPMVTTTTFTYSGDRKRPLWLTVGQPIDVIFEDSFIIGNSRQFEGFVPMDDRVNITYAQPLNAATIIDLKERTRVYKATVSSITTIYRKGNPEWDVRVMELKPATKVDGSNKTLEDIDDERDLQELQDLAKEMKGGTTEALPSNPPDTCSTLCTYKNEKNCKMCQEGFRERKGGWTSEHGKNYYCDWCGNLHHNGDIVYVTGTRDESYCLDCFPYVIQHLTSKQSVLN